ncbi:MAG: hypothetical protein ACUVSQ_00075 [Pseudanabaenaceae cyanobacterium]
MAAKTLRLRTLGWLGLSLSSLWLTGCAETPTGKWLERALAPAAPVAESAFKPADTEASFFRRQENVPADLPVPAAAQLLEAWQWEQGGTARWQTREAPAAVIRFYQDQGFRGDRVLVAQTERQWAIVYVQEGQPTLITLQYALGVPTPEGKPSSPAPPEVGSVWQQYRQDLQALGILGEEDPDRPVRRREFARWLWQTNNTLFADVPARQVRPGRTSDSPLFGDVPVTDRDFTAIQGLAAAGLIPIAPTFNPEGVLTRQDLLIWKVPLDTRRPLPGATVQAVQEAWGFQDVATLSPRGLQAALADAAGGDTANIRRSLGLTLRLQPQQPVTVAEAAAALWYVGDPKEGRSAQSVLAARQLTNPAPQESGEKN